MVNNHSAFINFDNNKLKLTSKRLEDLKGSRKSLRKKIRSYIENEKPNEISPKFGDQGSIPMETAVNPIPVIIDEDTTLLPFDLDDGVYFIVPNEYEERKSINTYHSWIVNAVDGHTNTTPIDKTTCVRVIFADGHNIDLPIYFMVEGGIPEIAHKSRGWIKSDPLAFAQWFNEKADDDPQLRRIVRYLKAWRNFREVNNNSLKLPSGFELTILAAENFKPNERDDVALRDTANAIYGTLQDSFECWRPTTPIEDVFEEYSETRENNFLDALERLVNNCDKAAQETNYKTSSEHLRKEFGDRFPLGKDEELKEKKSRIAKGLAATVAPRPYCSDNG